MKKLLAYDFAKRVYLHFTSKRSKMDHSSLTVGEAADPAESHRLEAARGLKPRINSQRPKKNIWTRVWEWFKPNPAKAYQKVLSDNLTQDILQEELRKGGY